MDVVAQPFTGFYVPPDDAIFISLKASFCCSYSGSSQQSAKLSTLAAVTLQCWRGTVWVLCWDDLLST